MDFEEGYVFFEKNVVGSVAGIMGDQYIKTVNSEIDDLVKKLNDMQGFKTNILAMKGDVAEFWHAGTFNIDAAVKDSDHRARVERSHAFASVDISTNYGDKYGVKYNKLGIESAKQQAKSIFGRFKEYASEGGKESFEEFLSKRGYSEDTILSDPIYAGQLRLIPVDQLKDAIGWLKRKISEEALKSPEHVKRYQETLDLLRDRINDNKGNESIPLSKEDAEKLAFLAKVGGIDPAELGLTTEELIKFEYVLKQAFKAGVTAATISMVLKIAPEIMKAVEYLIKNGEIDKEQFKKTGFAVLGGASEGFLRGTVSAAITTCCKSGLLGNALKNIDPSVVGTVTVLVLDTMKNACKVAIGETTRYVMANDLIRQMFTSTCSLTMGAVGQAFIEIPILGFMIGSFVGSLVGSFVYQVGYKRVISFCVDTGFTMFGLVEQNYEIPDDVMAEIGIDVFNYEKFNYEKYKPTRFEYSKFLAESFDADLFDMHFLRRGVIGVSRIGFLE